MFRAFGDIPHCLNRRDDILLGRRDEAKHKEALKTVLQQARDHGVTFNKEKWQFGETNALYLSVNVFSTKVLVEDRHFTWSSEPRESLVICRAKRVPSFLRYFKTLSIGPVSGIEPATSRSAVKRTYPAAGENRLTFLDMSSPRTD